MKKEGKFGMFRVGFAGRVTEPDEVIWQIYSDLSSSSVFSVKSVVKIFLFDGRPNAGLTAP
jgi:hypothetical protein